MRNALLALFFAMVLCIGLFIFVAKMLTFALFFLCRFFSVSLPRFSWVFFRCAFRFSVSEAFACYNFVFRSLFAFVYGLLMFFLAIFVVSVFFAICGHSCRCHFLIFRGFFVAVPSVLMFRRLLFVILLHPVLFLRLLMIF